MMDNEIKDTIIRNYISGSWPGIGPKRMRSGNPLKCPRCGNDSLYSMIALPKVRGLPRSKKRRIQKKWTKKIRTELLIETFSLIAANTRPPFECTCGYRAGFYRTVADSIFTVQPLPDGAIPIYTKDTDNGDHTRTSH